MTGTATEGDLQRPSRRTRLLGGGLIGIIGGGAAIVSLGLAAVLVVILDTFVLPRGPISTEQLTIVDQTGRWATSVDPEGGCSYRVRSTLGDVSVLHWICGARAGEVIRVRRQRSMLLRRQLHVEAPVRCTGDEPC